MKQIIFLIAFSLLLCTENNAQFSLGVSGGASFSKINFEGDIMPDIRQADYYFLSVIPKYNFTDKFAIVSDVQYSLKGYEIINTDIVDITKIRNTYLDFLPKIEYQIIEPLAIGFGGYIGFLLDEETTFQGKWISTKKFKTYTSTDYGLTFSVRGSVKNFFVTAAYHHGLKDISGITFTDENGAPLDVSQHNRMFQIGAGYFFRFKKG